MRAIDPTKINVFSLMDNYSDRPNKVEVSSQTMALPEKMIKQQIYHLVELVKQSPPEPILAKLSIEQYKQAVQSGEYNLDVDNLVSRLASELCLFD